MEKQKTDKILYKMLPRCVVDRMNSGRSTFSRIGCTVLFCDLANYTAYASMTDPLSLDLDLDRIYSVFDKLTEIHACEKLKIIGDADVVFNRRHSQQQ